MEQKLYFDNDEEGVARETSHPNFVSKLPEEFYYDILDNLSPFGNDDGADALFELQDWYRKTKGKGDIMKWLFKYIDGMGFKYSSADCSKIIDMETLGELETEDPFFTRCMDNSIIAIAFGQYKISGLLDSRLKETALLSFRRQKMIIASGNTPYADELLRTYSKMETDLIGLN